MHVGEGGVDGIADDGGRGKNEDQWREGVEGDAIGNTPATMGTANGENGCGTETIENPANKDGPVGQDGKTSRERQNAGPNTENKNRGGGCAETGVDVGELFEKEIIVGHGEEDARRGEHDAVRGAERGDEDGGGNEFAGPRAENAGSGSSGDGVAGGGGTGAESDKVSDYSKEIEAGEYHGADQKGAWKAFLRIHDFTGAVGAKLPALISPEHGDHRETEGLEERVAG